MTRHIGSGTLVIATHNAGKLKEITALLEPHGVKCISAGSPGLPDPAETGHSFAENALIKARAASEASGMVALAEDRKSVVYGKSVLVSVDVGGGRILNKKKKKTKKTKY